MPNDNESCKKITAITTFALVSTTLATFGLYNMIQNATLSCNEGNSNSTRLTGLTCQESLYPFYSIGGLIIATSTLALAMYARSRVESRATEDPNISLEAPQRNSSDLNRSTPHQNATDPSTQLVANSRAQIVFLAEQNLRS